MRNTFFLCRLSCLILFAVAGAGTLWGQNIRIGTEDKGAAYTIAAGVTSQTMTFTEAGATATASSDAIWNGLITMADSGTISVGSGGTLTVGGGIGGGGELIKSGSGTLSLNSTSSQTWATVVTAGTFQAAKNKVLSVGSAFILNGGTLDLNDTTQEIAALSGSGTLKFGSGGTGEITVGDDDSDTTFSGTFSDDGALIKTGDGSLFLTGADSASAIRFDVQSGTLVANAAFTGATATVHETGILGGNGTLFDVLVESGGRLAPGTRTGADVLATDTLTVSNDLTLAAGSTLSVRVDAAGNSDKVIVGGTYLNADGGAKLEIVALAGDYDATETYNAFLVDGTGANRADFAAANISVKQKFLELTNVTEAPNTFQLARKTNYFLARARTYNQRQVAKVFDQTTAPALWQAMTNIGNSANRAEIDTAYIELSGSIKANAHMLGQWQTSRYGLNHLDLSPACKADGSFWLEFIHQSFDFDPTHNSAEYGISRTGVLLGTEERCGDFTFGMLGGYAKPYLYSNGDKYDVGDLVFGFYGGTKSWDLLETKLYVGFGSQSYDSKRHLRSSLLVDEVQRIHGKFSGNSMSMALEFAVPFSIGVVGLRPVLAFDSDLSWQYGYTETGDTGFELNYDRSFFDRTYVRTGFTAQLGSVHECSPISLHGRAYYGRQVGGHAFPVTRSSFVTDPGSVMTIFGANPGRDYINLGLGFRWNFDSCLSFYGDYDYSALNNGTGHAGSLGFMQKW